MNLRADVSANRTSTQQLSLSNALGVGPDQSAIRTILRPFDAVAYVYAGLETFGEEQRETRWRELAAQLDRQGAPAPAIVALTACAAAAKEAPGTLALFASDDGTMLHEHQIADTSLPDRAGYRSPAEVMPLLAWEQQRPPYVLVVADRAGADVTACAGDDQSSRTWPVIGPDDEIERNSPGGWSQPRYQRRAEDSWKHNAGRVADVVAAALAEVGAQVLVLSGDVRAIQFLTEQLPKDLGALVCHITGSRAADGSQSGRKNQVADALRDAATAQTQALLEHLQSHLGPGGVAVEGRVATLEALAAGRVAMLLITDPSDEGPLVWFGAGPSEIYPDHESASLTGVPIRSGSLADVAARSALMCDARVRVINPGIPGEPLDGIGAICRYGL